MGRCALVLQNAWQEWRLNGKGLRLSSPSVRCRLLEGSGGRLLLLFLLPLLLLLLLEEEEEEEEGAEAAESKKEGVSPR